MAQLDSFELLPEARARVQLWGIGWQTLQMQSRRCAIGQALFDDLTAMNRGAIPDDDPAAGHLTPQVRQEGDDIRRVAGMTLAAAIELARRRDGPDGREMIAGAPFPQDGGLTHRRIGAHDTREGIKPRLVYEEEGLLLGFRPLLMAGQVSSRPWAMAASSRWRARRAGFCGLHRPALHKRPTWRG
jgi:hypothetical protein